VRDLFVTTHTPALGSGHSVRSYGIIRALAEQRGVDVLYTRFGALEPDGAYGTIAGVEMHESLASRGAKRAATYARALATGVPEWVARGVSPDLADAARRLARMPDRGRVIADGPEAAATLAGLSRRRPVIYNAHNLEFAFRHEISEEEARGTERMRRFERAVLARSAESWMVSESDLAGARELCPQAHLRYVPNVVDAAAIEPVGALPSERRALFVATFTYEPNQAGLRFMIDQVLPLVWAELPDAELVVVGRGLDEPPSQDPRVKTLGFVEDLRPVYAQARCAVVPLLQGGGTPLKLVEALARGLPVVATPAAVKGLDVRDGEHCLIADGAEAFATALVSLLRDDHGELGRRGRRLALERYSIEALAELLADGAPVDMRPTDP
jgi:glycosyltransferase involved in cell wall biosynthesis